MVKWFDKGKVKGYRAPTGKKGRKIPRDNLVAFMKENGIPMGNLDEEEIFRILGVSLDYLVMMTMGNMFIEEEGYRLEFTSSAFQAGILLVEQNPDVVLVGFSLGEGIAAQLAETVGHRPTFRPPVVAITGQDKDESVKITGFDKVFNTPVNCAALEHYINNKFIEKFKPKK